MSGGREIKEKGPKRPFTQDQHKWMQSFLKLPAAKSGSNGDASVQAAPAGDSALPTTMPAANMKDEEIAAEIMDKQAAILEGWIGALRVFDKVMTSSADAEASPNFQKVITTYFADKLMGAMIKQAPGAGELSAVAGVLAAEVNRAQAATGSAKLRDFVVDHQQAVTGLLQKTLAQRQQFISAVRGKREAVEAPVPAKGKHHKGGAVEPTKEDEDYAMMRMALMDTLDRVDAVLKVSTTQALFRVLSEEWVRNNQVSVGMGVKVPAVVIIRLDTSYRVMDAHIQGSGGQKLAEQLLKDSPDGVELLGLKAPKRILLMADNGWPSVTLSLDANNRDISTGSFGEGNTDALFKVVMSKGIPATKKLTGD